MADLTTAMKRTESNASDHHRHIQFASDDPASPPHRHHPSHSEPFEHNPFEGGWRPQIDQAGVVKRGKVPRFDGRSMRDWQHLHDKKLQVAMKAVADAPTHHRQLPRIPRSEVEKHNTMDDLWMVIHNIVYDVTVWQHYHPGGEHILRDCAGRDVTDLYDYYHRWVSCEGIIGALAVGFLAPATTEEEKALEEGDPQDPVELLIEAEKAASDE